MKVMDIVLPLPTDKVNGLVLRNLHNLNKLRSYSPTAKRIRVKYNG